MKTSQRTFRRVGLVAGTTLLTLAAIGPAASPAFAKPSGSIWTTNADCGDGAAQNANSYSVGETVSVRGSGFAGSAAFSWMITGVSGNSPDKGIVIASGSSATDASGAFCIAAYVVEPDDNGVYSVDVIQGSTSKNDNYHVKGEQSGDSGNEDADDPSDAPTDDPGDQGGEETVEEPTDDPGDQGGEETVEEPTDDPGDQGGEETVDEPTDEAPADEDTATDDETSVDAPPATESGSEPDTDTDYSQEVLGTVGGPTLTPPPSDIAVAPSSQTNGNEWRLILAFLGVLVLVATVGLPERRRAA
jgi:hypothetical protein